MMLLFLTGKIDVTNLPYVPASWTLHRNHGWTQGRQTSETCFIWKKQPVSLFAQTVWAFVLRLHKIFSSTFCPPCTHSELIPMSQHHMSATRNHLEWQRLDQKIKIKVDPQEPATLLWNLPQVFNFAKRFHLLPESSSHHLSSFSISSFYVFFLLSKTLISIWLFIYL